LKIRASCLVLILLVGGCAASPSSNATATPRTSSPVGGVVTESVSAPPSPAASGMHGIIVLDCNNGDQHATLTAYDPTTGAPGATLAFEAGDAQTAVCPYSTTETPALTPIRNRFNRDYTQLAAVMKQPDGSTHIGYLSPDGGFTDLTPAEASNYGSVTPNQSHPVFDPKTDRLWFYDATTKSHLGSVDPAAGPSSQQAESSSMYHDGFFYRGPNFTSTGTLVNNDGLYTPDGKFSLGVGSFLYDQVLTEWTLHRANDNGSVDDAKDPILQMAKNSPAPNCLPTSFIDSRRFLCVGNGAQDDPYGLFTMTISADNHRLSQVALLPASHHAILAQSSSPDGTQVAFISGDVLYLATSTTGVTEPQKLAELNIETGLTRYEEIVSWDQ
jgi:hypothetical protein